MYICRPPDWFNIPVVLVQGVDAIPLLQHILDQKKNGNGHRIRFGIAKSSWSIPETQVTKSYTLGFRGNAKTNNSINRFTSIVENIIYIFIYLQFICDANSNEKCIPANRIIGGNENIKGRLNYKKADWSL